ncbi:MAG: hypothetical protein PHN22_04790 [Candidatus ainarchaeum sp.]|nr:hypothetical protein [Candidatus ainarchaeum sp.]
MTKRKRENECIFSILSRCVKKLHKQTENEMNKYKESLNNIKIEQKTKEFESQFLTDPNLQEYLDLINKLENQFWGIHHKAIHREEKYILKKGKRIKLKISKKDEQIYDFYLQYFAQELFLIKKNCIQGFYIQSYALIRTAYETLIQIYYSIVTKKNVIFREIQKNKFSIALKDMHEKLYGKKSKQLEFYSEISKMAHPTINGLGFQGTLHYYSIHQICEFLFNLYYYGFILIYEYKRQFLYVDDLKKIQQLLNQITDFEEIQEHGVWDILPQDTKNLIIKDIPIQLI